MCGPGVSSKTNQIKEGAKKRRGRSESKGREKERGKVRARMAGCCAHRALEAEHLEGRAEGRQAGQPAAQARALAQVEKLGFRATPRKRGHVAGQRAAPHRAQLAEVRLAHTKQGMEGLKKEEEEEEEEKEEESDEEEEGGQHQDMGCTKKTYTHM